MTCFQWADFDLALTSAQNQTGRLRAAKTNARAVETESGVVIGPGH